MAGVIDNNNKKGNYTKRDDILRAMTADSKKVFYENLEKNTPQYPNLVEVITSDSMEEKYQTIGNLKPAEEKPEGAPINYGEIKQGYENILKNITYSNGFAISYEAVNDNKWGIDNKVKGSELARTMNSRKEQECANVWDNVLTGIGVDGVAYASHKHPLLNNSSKFNDNLVEGEFNTDTYTEACNKFNEWFNHSGEKFDTNPNKIIAHKNRQFQIMAMFQSQNVAFEQSNTKNTIPTLNTAFNTYINKKMVHLVDTTITTAVLQQREELFTESYFDNSGNLNYYFAAIERYVTGMLNNGFGFLTINGEKAEETV